MTTLRAGSATHVGQVRSNNQDSALMVDDANLFGVADGMGGHQGGEVASAMAVELAKAHSADRTLESLKQAARVANRAIFEKAGNDPDLHGMGTTLVAVQLVDGPEGDEIGWINVGDSRVYLLRDGELRQLSHDHSLVEDLVRDGRISREEAKVHPQRNILTRALGIDLDVNVDSGSLLPLAGDRYLLCSDGLFNEVTLDQMSAALRRLVDPDEAAAELVRLANDGGGRDNITVVIVDVIDDDGRAAAIAEAQAAAIAAAEAKAAAERAAAERAEREAALAEQESDDLEPAALAGRRSSLPEADDDYRAEKDDLFADMDRMGAKRFTWRVLAFVAALLLVVAVVVGAIGWSARRTYHVAYRGDVVAVYKGQPEGFLWIEPTLDHDTLIERDDVPVEYRNAIAEGKEFGSAQAANAWLFQLQAEIDEREERSTTTTTESTTTTEATTTTRPTTTTAPANPTTTAAPTTQPPP